jgi:transcriptional regulator with XRE-family HTH domain
MELREILGRRVRMLREDRRWSQEQLGKAARLGGKYIGMIERGEKAASFEAVERIAKALKVECYELFVPLDRRSEAVERHVKGLLAARPRDDARLDEFLEALLAALRKLG